MVYNLIHCSLKHLFFLLYTDIFVYFLYTDKLKSGKHVPRCLRSKAEHKLLCNKLPPCYHLFWYMLHVWKLIPYLISFYQILFCICFFLPPCSFDKFLFQNSCFSFVSSFISMILSIIFLLSVLFLKDFLLFIHFLSFLLFFSLYLLPLFFFYYFLFLYFVRLFFYSHAISTVFFLQRICFCLFN